MSYATGTANNPTDLLQQLATFAAAQGWTVDRNASYLTNYWMALHNGASYFNFATEATAKSFLVTGATGYNSANTPTTQPGGSPQATYTLGIVGPYTAYYFFAGSTYIHIVIEVNAGLFLIMMIGQMPAAGGISDAVFVQGTNWSVNSGAPNQPDSAANNAPFFYNSQITKNMIGATVDSTFRWFQDPSVGASPARYQAPLRSQGVLATLLQRAANTFNGLTVLLPLPIFVERGVGNIYSFAGIVPGLRAINVANINPKDEVTLGGNTYKQFPAIAKTATWNVSGSTVFSSGPYGYAFLK